MKIEYKRVAVCAVHPLKPLAEFAIGAFLFFCTNTGAQALATDSYEAAPVVVGCVNLEISMQNGSDLSICVADNIETTADKLNLAFSLDNMTKTEESAHAHAFILETVKNIEVGKVKYEFNSVLKVANYTMSLPHGLLLSVSKSLESLDDDTLTFSIFHARKLLVSDMVHAHILSEYISNVQSRLNKS